MLIIFVMYDFIHCKWSLYQNHDDNIPKCSYLTHEEELAKPHLPRKRLLKLTYRRQVQYDTI